MIELRHILLSFLFIFCVRTESNNLTQETFQQFIQDNERVLVLFYAPWCGHCKRIAPEFEAAAKQLISDNAGTKLAKVDAQKESTLAQDEKIKGYPTLKYYINGEAVEYTGGRSKEKILAWVHSQELPAVSELGTKEEVADLLSKGDSVLIAYLLPGDTAGREELQKAAELLRLDVVTGLVVDTFVASNQGMQVPSLAFHTRFQEMPVVLEGDVTKTRVMGLFRRERFPPLGEIGPDNYQAYMDRGLPLAWVASDPGDKNKVIELLEPYAIHRKGILSFVWVNAEKFSGHVENLGLDKVPGFLIIDDKTNDKYKFTGDIESRNDLGDFWRKFDDNALPKFMKTQPVPADDGAPVLTLVGSTFADKVFVDDAVFVKFYAPWCGHCKKLAPAWKKLGESCKDRSDLTIAKIDATENDTPEAVEGYPTLILYGKGCKEIGCGEKYAGVREASEMQAWLEDKYPEARPTESGGSLEKDEL